MPYLPYLQISCAFNSSLNSKMSTFSSSPAPASPMSPASAQLPIHTAQTFSFSSSPAPASPILPASAQLPIHTAQTLKSSLRTSIAGISAQGSQKIDQLLQSDAWILNSPLKGPPPSPVVERPRTPIERVVGMIVLSPLSPPPALNQEITL
jgi:hypothetical protein